MKKQFILGFVVAFATQAGAQAMYSGDSDPARLIEKNSDFCGFTFFSEGDDIIDFRGQKGLPCFDLKAGQDILAFNPEDFPEGVQVYTGPGRDILLLPDGNDLVTAFDDTDKEYDLRSGDDTVQIPGRLAYGISNPGRGPKTVINPGTGRDKIEFGDERLSEDLRFRSPNLIIDGNSPGVLEINSSCGRYLDGRYTDVTFSKNAPEKKVMVSSKGCGLMFAEQSGPLDLSQVGGRLSLSVVKQDWGEGSDPALINADIEEGMSLSAGFSYASRLSSFSWKGFGPAAVSASFEGQGAGGNYALSSSSAVHTSVDLRNGEAKFEISSLEGIELRLQGATMNNRMVFDLISPETKILWHPAAGDFPAIKTRGEAAVEEMTERKPGDREEVENALQEETERLLDARKRSQEGSSDLPGGGRPQEADGQNGKLDEKTRFFAARAHRPVSKERVVEGAPALMSIFREQEEGACFRVVVRDWEEARPDVNVGCSEGIFSQDVSEYEEVHIMKGEEKISSFVMNGVSDFLVKEISFRK